MSDRRVVVLHCIFYCCFGLSLVPNRLLCRRRRRRLHFVVHKRPPKTLWGRGRHRSHERTKSLSLIFSAKSCGSSRAGCSSRLNRNELRIAILWALRLWSVVLLNVHYILQDAQLAARKRAARLAATGRAFDLHKMAPLHQLLSSQAPRLEHAPPNAAANLEDLLDKDCNSTH